MADYQGKVTSALRRAYLGCKTVAHSKCVAKDNKAQTAKQCGPVESRLARRSACLTVLRLLNFTNTTDRNRSIKLAISKLFHKLDCVWCLELDIAKNWHLS